MNFNVSSHRQGGPASRVIVDELAQEIQARVMGGTIPIGSWLRQETLAVEFGVSRTPVREALRKLQASGIVELIPHRGALVRGPTARDIREAYLVRADLEGLAAELATTWIREDQLERLRTAEELFRRSVEELATRRPSRSGAALKSGDEPWVRANTLFHEVVQEAASNERLRTTISDLHRSFPRNLTWAALRENPRLLPENVAEHRRILEAIETGDASEARQAMTEHVRRAGELVTTWFEREAYLATSGPSQPQPSPASSVSSSKLRTTPAGRVPRTGKQM
jgi:DNA-binding GntR family transcriptional regulator